MHFFSFFFPEDNASDESRTSSSFDEYAQQVDAVIWLFFFGWGKKSECVRFYSSDSFWN